MEETQCQREHCHNTIQQVPGNHRRRLYCSDTCKQQAFRERKQQHDQEKRQAAIRERWSGFRPDTQQVLETVMVVCSEALYGKEENLMTRLAEAIRAEQSQPAQTQHEDPKRKPSAKMTKADTRELEQARADILRLYQERAREQEVFHQLYEQLQDLSLDLGAARHRIAELEEHPVMLSDLLFALGAQLDYPEFWFDSPQWKVSAAIPKGREYWQRFCERAAAMEVKAAYEAAQQRVSELKKEGEQLRAAC
jgi:hypothetical protein